jgi:hypothetical protein
MKKVIIILLTLVSVKSPAQCFLAMDEITNVQVEDQTNTISPEKIQQLRFEFGQMCQLFGVTAELKFYNEPGRSNAFTVCRQSANQISIGEKLIRQHSSTFNNDISAIVGAMAHEVAHLYLCRMHYSGTATQQEHLADFLAGYLLSVRSFFLPTNIFSFSKTLYEMGDSEFTSTQHHGSPEERVRYMTLGCNYGQTQVNDAYVLGQRWINGSIGLFDLTGNWYSTTGASFKISHIIDSYGQQAITCAGNTPGVFYSALRIGQNNFRANFLDNFGNISSFLDFLVISEKRIIVTAWPNGQSVLWQK